MKTLLRPILITIFGQLCAGYSFFPHTGEFDSNYKSAYLHSKNGSNLIIPKPLTDANLSDFYLLPNQTTSVLVISTNPPIVKTSE